MFFRQVSNEPGMRYNVPLMNALVLYVGVAAIQVIQSVGKTPSMSTIPHSPHMDVYQNLAVDLDTEGQSSEIMSCHVTEVGVRKNW